MLTFLGWFLGLATIALLPLVIALSTTSISTVGAPADSQMAKMCANQAIEVGEDKILMGIFWRCFYWTSFFYSFFLVPFVM